MGIIDVKINKITEKDRQNLKDPQVSNKIKVINVRKEEYAGIAPGQIGTIDVSKWGPYQFALKKLRETSEVAKEVKNKEESKPNLNKPKGQIDLKVLLQAFNHAAGGPARAAILIGIERTTYHDWVSGTCTPSSPEMPTWEDLMELLTDNEKVLFKSKVIELCQEEAQKIPTKKSLLARVKSSNGKSKKGSPKTQKIITTQRTPKSQKSSKTRGEAEQKD